MTSIAHPVLPGAVPAVGGSTSAGSVPLERRWLQPAGSKAVRLGLGVAIAAVMAGDVYAVLRSPVSEGRGAGSTAASAAMDETSAASASPAASGHVAMNPFSDAAYGASMRPASVPAAMLAGRGGVPAVASAPSASSLLPAAPSSAPAPAIVLPTAPSTPLPGAPTGPEWHQETPQDETPAPAPSLLAPVVDPVISTVHDVPVAGPTVAPVVQQVVDSVPTGDVAPAASTVPLPTSSLLGR